MTDGLTGKFAVDPTTGCHVWQRAIQSRGYGSVWFDGKVRLAHRVAWFLRYGRWPADGRVLDHICNNKACVNVAHIRELPNSLNIRRAYEPCDEETMRRRIRWRRANQRRRTYAPDYTVGGE